jgi:hypothetical protein
VWRSPVFSAQITKTTNILQSSPSKNVEIALKIKRLKQIKGEGGNYDKFLVEQKRYKRDNETNENIIERMKKVVDYKESIATASTKALVINAIRDNKLKKDILELDIVFLPDSSINETKRWFYPTLLSSFYSDNEISDKKSLVLLNMPNVHEFNTKRYEVQWMNYMRNDLNISRRDVVIAHGTSADALLRYVETGHILYISI